jgi:hypothetical protein
LLKILAQERKIQNHLSLWSLTEADQIIQKELHYELHWGRPHKHIQ